ncbi:MAG: pilus assembly protein PilM [Syntrophomonadaceae bacterium]|nr:pilus assembly protein PilM [Syntrophomonadaceae bacterium]
MALLTKNKWTGLGLEMGCKQMRMVCIESDQTTAWLTGFGEVPIPDEAMENGRICRPEPITASLLKLYGSMDTKCTNVVMSLPDTAVFVRELVLPHMKIQDLFRAARFHALSVLPLALEEMVVQVSSIRPLDEEMVELTIVATRQDEVREWAQIATMAGMKPIVEIRPLAVARAMQMEGDPQIILDLGEKTTGISYFDRGQLRYMRSIPKGWYSSSGELTRDWDDLAISETVGNYPFARWLGDEIDRSFEFWGRNRIIPLEVRQIHVTGRNEMVNDIDEPWPNRFPPLQRAHPWKAIEPPADLRQEDRSRLEYDFVAAIGLAMRKVK